MTTQTDPSWDAVDLDHRPAQRRGVAERALGDDLVVYDPSTGAAHVLNATARVIWPVLDGSVSIIDLAGEVADAFEAPREVVAEDLLGLIRALGRIGLLDGVEREPVPAESAWYEGC